MKTEASSLPARRAAFYQSGADRDRPVACRGGLKSHWAWSIGLVTDLYIARRPMTFTNATAPTSSW